MILESGTRKRLFPFVLWVLFCCVTAAWLLIRPMELSFDFQAEKNCTLQLIFSSEESFSAKTSNIVTVTPVKTRCFFSLPERTRRIRLIPGKLPENSVTIRHFSLIRNGIFRTRIVNPADGVLKPVRDVILSDGAFKVTGWQPELDVSEEWIRQRKPDIRLCSLAALLFLLGSAVILSIKWDDWCSLGSGAFRLAEQLTNYCRENRYFLIYMFGCLLILFGYEMFNLPISEDDDWYLISKFEQLENSMPGAYSTLSYNSLAENFLHHGRWSAAVLLKIFTGFCPVLSLVWCLVCLSAVFLLMAERFSLPQPVRYLLYPLFIGNPVSCVYLTFLMTYNSFGICMLTVFFIALWWPQCRDWHVNAVLISLSVFVITTAQSMILFFPLLFLLSKMSEGLDQPFKYKQSLADLLKLCGMCLLIFLSYVLALKYTLWLFDVQWQYLGNFLQKPDSLHSIMLFAVELLKKMLSVYSGKFEFAIHGQLLLILLMAAAVIIRMIRKKRCLTDILVMAVGLAALLILPFALDIAAFNTAIPVRSMVSFPIMITGLCILGWRALDDCPKIRFFAGLLIVFVSVQYAILINQKAYASKLRYDQDRSILQSIKDRCYQIPGFTAQLNGKKKIPLAVVGNLIVPKHRSFPMWCDSILNCSFEPALVINLHLLGETYFYPASKTEMKKIFPLAMKMPSWPAAGSVRFENGIMIVKLSGFNETQCKQYGFTFLPVIGDNSIHRLKKLPAAVRPVWSLTPETLDSVQDCKVAFEQGRIAVKPSGWHSLRSKPVQAAPNKIYYLQIESLKCKKNGLLYLSFSDPDRYGQEVTAEINIVRGEKDCILRIPGRLLAGPIAALLGDMPGREQIFNKFVLLEPAETENLLDP